MVSPSLPQKGDTQRERIAPSSRHGDEAFLKGAGHICGLPGHGDWSGLDPSSWAASRSGRGPFLTPVIWVSLPNDFDEEPELPMLEAIGIALLLWLVLAVLCAWGLYWFW